MYLFSMIQKPSIIRANGKQILILDSTREKLVKLKLHPREPWNDVINRLCDKALTVNESGSGPII